MFISHIPRCLDIHEIRLYSFVKVVNSNTEAGADVNVVAVSYLSVGVPTGKTT